MLVCYHNTVIVRPPLFSDHLSTSSTIHRLHRFPSSILIWTRNWFLNPSLLPPTAVFTTSIPSRFVTRIWARAREDTGTASVIPETVDTTSSTRDDDTSFPHRVSKMVDLWRRRRAVTRSALTAQTGSIGWSCMITVTLHNHQPLAQPHQ
jgi:hypothetical protein